MSDNVSGRQRTVCACVPVRVCFVHLSYAFPASVSSSLKCSNAHTAFALVRFSIPI